MSKERRLGRGLAALLGDNDEMARSDFGPTPAAEDVFEYGNEPEGYSAASEFVANRNSNSSLGHQAVVPPQTAPPAGAANAASNAIPNAIPNAPVRVISGVIPANSPSVRLDTDELVAAGSAPLYDVARGSSPSGLDAHESNGGARPLDNDTILLRVDEIDENPFQPRRVFSEAEIGSLAESLKAHDMLSPVLVRRVGTRWQLISGERRLRAAIQAGWNEIPARVRDADDRLVAELAIVENLQRKDLNAIEKALSFRRYLEEHECTQEDLAQRLKIDRSTIANLVRLLELPQTIQADIQKGEITAGHARALLPLGDYEQQNAFATRIRTEGLSVRDIERMVQEKIQAEDDPIALAPGKGGKKKRPKSNHLASLEQRLRIALGTKVDIKANPRGRGQIVIHFKGNDEFERLNKILVDGAGGETKSFAG